MSQKFIGKPESQLLTVYHPRRGKTHDNVRAMLICSPIGQEYIRTHWSLRLLANQLARKGVHVLRFDYSGVGDSAGSIEQIASLDQWISDIELAIDELKRISGAQTVSLLGQRFGATMAAEVAMYRADVNSLVCLEPVVDGTDYLDRLRAMHSQMLDLWVCKMETPNNDQFEEILGSQFRRTLLNEIENSRLDFTSVVQPQLIIETVANQQEFSHPVDGIQKVLRDDRPSSWDELRELETALLRPVMTRKIVKTIDDMFDRLQRFNALQLQTAGV